MRTIITILTMVLAMNLAFSQTVITTFETGETPLYSTLTDSPQPDNQTVFDMDANNPDKTGINTTDKCLYILTNQIVSTESGVGRPAWYSNCFIIEFDNAVTIDENNRFLHIMHWKESLLNPWLIYGDSGNGTEVEIARGACPEAGKWFDIVVDIKAKINTVKKIRVVLDGNWGNTEESYYPPTKFYYDEIIMTGDSRPRGSGHGIYLTQSNILDFENKLDTDSKVTFTKQAAAYTNDIFYNNDDKTGINTSDKCCYFNRNSVAAPAWVWWHGFYFELIDPIYMGNSRYLHIMMKKSVAEGSNVQVSVQNFDPVVSSGQSAYLMSEKLTTEWVDYVFDIPSSHRYIKGIYLKFNNNSANTAIGCFADEFWIDNDPMSRAKLPTNLDPKNTAEKYTIELSGKQLNIQSLENSPLSIRIYTIDGCLVNAQQTSSLNMEFASSGIYILNIDGKTTKIIVK